MISFFNFLNNVIKKRTIENPNLSNGSTTAMSVVILYKGLYVLCYILYYLYMYILDSYYI